MLCYGRSVNGKTASHDQTGDRVRGLLWFFGAAFLLSTIALAVVGLPSLGSSSPPDRGQSASALVMFPVMVIGVAVIGLVLTRAMDGRGGPHDLRARFAVPVRPRWYAALLIPPATILTVLLVLRTVVSANFAPNLFALGVIAGLLAGFCEELGWTGFAYPRMRERFGPLLAAVALGALWAVWHLPIVDSLGAAAPHGSAWPAFFGAFVGLLIAVRMLIAWVYDHTGSLRMAQLMHACSTGALVVLSASHVTPFQEAGWYFTYAVVLSIVVLTLRARSRRAPGGVVESRALTIGSPHIGVSAGV
jgi:membrane protease YdiL (CAAX protease family)